MTRNFVCMLVALFACLFPVGSAFADDVDQLTNRVNEVRETLAVFETDPNVDAARLEIERADIDIDEARDRITRRHLEIAEISVIRAERRLQLIEATIFRATVDVLADERESATIDMTQQADEAQVDYEATEARQSALRNEVAEILNQLEVSE